MSEVGWDRLTILNREQLKLAGLLCYRNNRQSDQTQLTTIVVCHGFTGSKEGSGRALKLAESLALKGFNTLLFDFAGCGESEGSWHNLTLSRQTSDLASIVTWCRSAGLSKIVLLGRSFGGTTVINYAANDPLISGVCTWAAVASLETFFISLLLEPSDLISGEYISLKSAEGTIKLKKDFINDLKNHDILSAAANLSPCPLLVIHGSADATVHHSEADLLFASASRPKAKKIIVGADHRFSDHLDQVWSHFFTWLDHLE